MLAWLRSWKGGAAVAAACLLIGLGRVLSGELDWLTWVLFPLAAGYTVAAVIDHRARRPATRRARTGWATRPTRLDARNFARRGVADHPDAGQVPSPVTITLATSTKDRVGAVLAVAAAVVGLVLVFQDREIESHTAPAAPPSSSQGTLVPTG